MITPDYHREPWKHPACWNHHLVRMTRDYPAGVAVCVATCQCGWAACAKVAGGGEVARDDAVEHHWHSVIAEAEAVPA